MKRSTVNKIEKYIFKQSFNNKQVIITIPLRNYDHDDVQIAAENGQMILYWKNPIVDSILPSINNIDNHTNQSKY